MPRSRLSTTIAPRFHFHLLFHLHTIEQYILRMRIAFVSKCFNVEACGLSDRARRGRLERVRPEARHTPRDENLDAHHLLAVTELVRVRAISGLPRKSDALGWRRSAFNEVSAIMNTLGK